MEKFKHMNSQSLRDLHILTEIEGRKSVTQRSLATHLGIALGLANLYVKRLVKKGYIKVTTIPKNRVKYLLTPSGVAAKTRLTYEYMSYSLLQYRRARELVRELLSPLAPEAGKRIAFYGVGEAAEVAYLWLKEIGLEPSAVFDEGAGEEFLGIPVRTPENLVHEEFDSIILTSLGSRRVTKDREDTLLAWGVPPEKIVSLRM